MKKLAILSIMLIWAYCSHHVAIKVVDLKDFQTQLNKVEDEKKDLKTLMDKIHLKQLDQLSKTDTTDKNKREFEALKKDINKHLIPQFKNMKSQLNNYQLNIKMLKT